MTSTELRCRVCDNVKVTNVEFVLGLSVHTWWNIRQQVCTACLESITLPLERARTQLQTVMSTGGSEKCPCCDQLAKVYKRTMLRASALALVWAWHDFGMEPFHMPKLMQARVPQLAHQGGAATMGAYWGFIAESAEPREDGGRAGWWQLTEQGRAYVHGRSFPSHALTYNGKVLRTEGGPRCIQEALGAEFNLAELLAARPDAPVAVL